MQYENSALKKGAQYRRYTELDDTHDFRMDFCELRDEELEGYPSEISYPEHKEGISFRD